MNARGKGHNTIKIKNRGIGQMIGGNHGVQTTLIKLLASSRLHEHHCCGDR